MERRLRRLVPLAVLILAGAGCSHRSDLERPATHDNYGVEMARLNLWREAMFRFQRAVTIDPGDAMAHNNLAVAYEANGESDKARREYLEALRLDRNNSYIQKNYSRYVEFLSRNRKRPAGRSTTSGSKPPGPSAGAIGGTPATFPPDRPEAEGAAPRPPAPPVSRPSDLPPHAPPTPVVPPPVPPPASSAGAR